MADKELCASIRANPKIVVGSSDMTGLHWFLYGCTGLRTFYGPSAIPELGTADSVDDESSPLAFCVRSLLAAIANPEPLGKIPRSPIYAPKAPAFFRDRDSLEVQTVNQAPGWQWLRRGRGQGRLFGGCLSVVARLNGVRALAPDWRGRVVFLETSMGERAVLAFLTEYTDLPRLDVTVDTAFCSKQFLDTPFQLGIDTDEIFHFVYEFIIDIVTGICCFFKSLGGINFPMHLYEGMAPWLEREVLGYGNGQIVPYPKHGGPRPYWSSPPWHNPGQRLEGSNYTADKTQS